jgi:hypothetical protein
MQQLSSHVRYIAVYSCKFLFSEVIAGQAEDTPPDHDALAPAEAAQL